MFQEVFCLVLCPHLAFESHKLQVLIRKFSIRHADRKITLSLVAAADLTTFVNKSSSSLMISYLYVIL